MKEHKDKFARKRKTKNPCPGCGLHFDLCICSLIPRLDLKTRVCLVIHAKELKRTTNTGQLAMKALVNSEMHVRGQGTERLDLKVVLRPDYRSFLFYPSLDAQELNSSLVAESSLPIQLIVPDGNWRQAGKVHLRHPELSQLPRVMIKARNQSSLHLRAEHSDEGMATLQAIAFAMGVIEGEDIKRDLLELFEAKLRQTLKGRGQKNVGES